MSKTLYLAMVLLELAAVAGCSEDKPAPASNGGQASSLSIPAPHPQGSIQNSVVGDLPTIPKDAQFTIHCETFGAPNHAELAKTLKDQLTTVFGSGNFYKIDKDKTSSVFYGFYASIDHQTPAGHQASLDLNRLRLIKDSTGNPALPHAWIVPIDTPDPTDVNPEWNLARLPRTADHRYYWSVEIAAFRNNSLRKEAAVQMVKDLRAHNVEAYYYHGESISSVTIGVWPIDALKRQEADRAEAADPNEAIAVMTQFPTGYDKLFDRDGNPVRVMVQKIDISDPSLLATMQKYNWHAVNGEIPRHMHVDPSGAKQEVDDPSFLVICPSEATDSLDTPTQQAPMMSGDDASAGSSFGPRPPTVTPPNTPPPSDGTGHLRGLGE